MDQDFHYYGTLAAARIGGFSADEAALIARSANFIDFLHEKTYGGAWDLIDPSDGSTTVARLDHARLTFQSGLLSTGMWPEDGLWCSFHFTPGNYDHVAAPSTESLHGSAVASELPPFERRGVAASVEADAATMLNRPQSPLAHRLLEDALRCATDPQHLVDILSIAVAGRHLLAGDRPELLERFRLLLLGVRAHVIADTWAHQDFAGIDHKINTYYDVTNSFGRQAILYRDVGDEWKHVVLSSMNHENLQAVPNGTSYLGHGWMGHLPDFSFVGFRYKPAWRSPTADVVERDNPTQYRHAFLELVSLFAQAHGQRFDPASAGAVLAAAHRAIDRGIEIADRSICPRAASSEAWLEFLDAQGHRPAPRDLIDAEQEPHPNTVLPGVLERPSRVEQAVGLGRLGVALDSDLYLFQVAVDYHFHFVRSFLAEHDIHHFTGRWSQQPGPLGSEVADLV